jgi:hypothetical protein
VFGDPRRNGGGVGIALAGAMAFDAELTPVINGDYALAVVPFSIVSVDSPLPAEPPVLTPRAYGPLFIPSPSPEPASWMLMIAGLGMAGAILRHRRRSGPLGADHAMLPAGRWSGPA